MPAADNPSSSKMSFYDPAASCLNSVAAGAALPTKFFDGIVFGPSRFRILIGARWGV
jgi:hypothetical protein